MFSEIKDEEFFKDMKRKVTKILEGFGEIGCNLENYILENQQFPSGSEK